MDGYYLPFSGRPEASSQGAQHGTRVSAASRPSRLPAGLSPGFRGGFCSEAAVAGAPWRCQPWSNPMPKLSGFMQGLNLNLGKEKEERKVSLIAGLALNPSGGGDLPQAALTGTMALCKRARWGGISNPQIPTAPLRRELVGSGCQRRSSPCRLAGLWPPKTLGCCLGAATTVRRGSGAQPGAGWEHPRAPPAPLPEAWAQGMAARRAPAESLLAPAPAQRSQEHRGDVLWICNAGGAMYRPKMGRGEGASPRAELAPQPPASPESRDAISFPLLAVPSGPGPLVVGGEGRLVQPGVTGVLLGLPGVPCTFGAFGVPLLGAEKAEGGHGLRGLVQLWRR